MSNFISLLKYILQYIYLVSGNKVVGKVLTLNANTCYQFRYLFLIQPNIRKKKSYKQVNG